jgi:PadR family transcriptional regulator PadR
LRTEDLIEIILKLSRGREFYGYEIHKKLHSEGVEVEVSRFYRVLTTMLNEGYLESRWEKSPSGPKKRVYRLAEKGRKKLNEILLECIQTIHGFYADYILNLPSDADVFDRIYGPLVRELKERKNIGCMITSEYSPMHERMICSLHGNAPEGKIYVVRPHSVTVEPKVDNVTFLDGNFDNIPLKDGYLDLLVVTEIPRGDLLQPALTEWHRVLSEHGTLAILAPTVTFRKYEDPLTIGDFIEKYEHESIEKGEHLDSKLLMRLLRKFFQDIQEKQIVHMTLFIASRLESLHVRSGRTHAQ